MKKIGYILLIMMSTNALADDAENIMACVHTANEYSGVKLSEFEATYEGNIFSMSKARWPDAYCEVKLGDVYNLTVNDSYIIFEGFAGKAAYELNKQLEAKTEAAITQLKSRIVLLEQRMSQVSSDLKLPRPDLVQLTKYVDEGIDKSVKHSQTTTPVSDVTRVQRVINDTSHSSTAIDTQSVFSPHNNTDKNIKLGDYYVSSEKLNVRLDASRGGDWILLPL